MLDHVFLYRGSGSGDVSPALARYPLSYAEDRLHLRQKPSTLLIELLD